MVIIAVGIFMYNVGYKSAETEYTRQAAESKARQALLYEKRLKQERENYEKMLLQVNEYKQKADKLGSDVSALQLRIAESAAAGNKTLSCPANKSGTTATGEHGRDREMVEILRRATDLIAERDRIALQYNELREQCRLN